jgi:lysophospholipase L1-like esterase
VALVAGGAVVLLLAVWFTDAGRPGRTPDAVFVSIGDSYAAGYQPVSDSAGRTGRAGFAYRVTAALGDVSLANFGCVGVTVSGFLSDRGCEPGALGPDGIAYPDESQAAAALRYVTDHRGDIAGISVIIGGNDVRSCFESADALACAPGVVQHLQERLGPFLVALREAAGPSVQIAGLTYPDVVLGEYLQGRGEVAAQSLALFREALNPALEQAYSAAGIRFVDVTALTGAYAPAVPTKPLPPYGAVPPAVYDVCRYTFVCRYGDVHPTDEGYELIAEAVLEALGH